MKLRPDLGQGVFFDDFRVVLLVVTGPARTPLPPHRGGFIPRHVVHEQGLGLTVRKSGPRSGVATHSGEIEGMECYDGHKLVIFSPSPRTRCHPRQKSETFPITEKTIPAPIPACQARSNDSESRLQKPSVCFAIAERANDTDK